MTIHLHYTHTITTLTIILILIPTTISAHNCTTHAKTEHPHSKQALKYKLAAVAGVLTSGAAGISLPLLGRRFEALRPENDIFFMIKAFAAGVILATGFIHILPDAFAALTSPCLGKRGFPFAGFISMCASIGTLMVDTLATAMYKNMQGKQVVDDVADVEEGGDDHEHDAARKSSGGLSEILRQRIISQVLELGIVVHSVIIGISLGASQSPDTIKPLLVALSFHQFFEGMGLGGCISQAKFKSVTKTIMILFFSLTTPVGIGVGIGISSGYEANSARALIVEGVLNSASAGILIYMALVDLLAADFMNPRMESNVRLQMGAHISLLLGAGCMSFVAKWA